jgi:hypothetical protein
MTNIRKQKTGDQLAVGDWLAPGQITDGAAEVLFAHAYPASADRSRDNHGKHVRLVVRELGKAKTYSDVVAGTTLFVLASDEELAEYREEAERAQRIADIRAFADWLEDNPWAPLPCSFDAQVHLDERHLGGPSVADALAKVREVAPRLGVELEERLDDRTCARKSFGSVGYDVIAWHPNGRPDESRTGETVEDLGKNFDRSQTADGKPDTSGLGYFRPAEEPQPAGQRRVPSHFQHATDEGVDELPPTPAPTRVVHLSLRGDTACEKTVSSLPAGHGHSTEHADVTCKECLEAVPF